jgi:hypothetical protein
VKRLVVATLLAASRANAGPLEVEPGVSVVLYDTPSKAAAKATYTNLSAASLTVTLSPDAKLPVGIRLHASVSDQGSGLRTLGFALRQKSGKLVIDTGLSVASVVGVIDDTMTESLRPRGTGIALDLRIGYLVSGVVLSAFALPTYVFASDSFAPEARLRSAVEAGITFSVSL